MVGRMGEEGFLGARYRQVHGAPSYEGQIAADDTSVGVPMQKYVFPRQISRSWQKRPAVLIRVLIVYFVWTLFDCVLRSNSIACWKFFDCDKYRVTISFYRLYPGMMLREKELINKDWSVEVNLKVVFLVVVDVVCMAWGRVVRKALLKVLLIFFHCFCIIYWCLV